MIGREDGVPTFGSLNFEVSAMPRVYLLIGGNLGERERVQEEALRSVEAECGPAFSRSLLYKSAPWGFDHERDFLNRVVGIDSRHSPRGLLRQLLRIERPYQGRTLDLDILYFEDRIVREETLKIPHPRIPERRFTLLPLCEIAPGMEDPLREKSVRTMLGECPDPIEVKVFSKGCITST
ncbi:MAG: 2-amino-4-hydroxy-6-hydroxymethyldihydropteridine diphosphokinase [Flavobacteriales bacterium]